MTTSINIIVENENGVMWVEICGTDQGTNYQFDGDVYGVTEDKRILDCDGAPLTDGDYETVAVQNALSY